MQPRTNPATLGTRLSQLTVNGFTLTETSHPAGRHLPRHCHRCANFVVVLQGNFTETCAGHTFACGPQNVLLKPAGEPHADVYGAQGARCLVIDIEEQRLLGLPQPLDGLKRLELSQGGELFNLGARAYREFQTPDAASSLAIEGLMLEMLAEAIRLRMTSTDPKPPPWLEQARQFIEAHFAQSFSLADLATEVGVHPFHLARQFRRYFHCTVGERVRQRRIEFACRQLANGDLPLVEIALAAGFAHQPHFCRVFKQQTGLTPSAYRAHSHLR
jgi:AraC family transcriptional regulator